jgi:hypothetical protein
MRKLEQEGWMKVLCGSWTSAKANVPELEKLREAQMQLQIRGIHADPSAAQFPLLTAKMQPKDVSGLKKSFARQGFVEEIEALEGEGKKFAAELGSKQAATPSATWKMLMSARPEAVLWVAYSTKSAPLQAKFKNFYTEWPQARQRIPYTVMQEMRIIPGISGYDELVEKLFFELMDNKLGTPEEMKAYLEPYSPPAPPPPVHLRRARATKKEAKSPKGRKKAGAEDGSAGEGEVSEEAALAAGAASQEESAETGKTSAAKAKAPAKITPPAKHAAPVKAVAAKVEAKKPVAAKAAAVKAKAPAKKAAPVKAAAKKVVAKAPAKAVKHASKLSHKPAAKGKPAAKPAAKKAPVKAKPVAKHPAKKALAKKKR